MNKTEYLRYLKWFHGRLGEIVAKIEKMDSELTEHDADFLAAMSKEFYKKR
jgi:hypothetical protein